MYNLSDIVRLFYICIFQLLIYNVDRLMIHLDNRTIVIDNCIFAVCNKQLKIEEEILLHPDLAGVQNNQVMKGNYHVKFNSRSSL